MLLRLDINLEVAAIISEDSMSTSPSLWGGMIEGEKNLAVKQDGTFSSYKSWVDWKQSDNAVDMRQHMIGWEAYKYFCDIIDKSTLRLN